jgi:hypothetical protein
LPNPSLTLACRWLADNLPGATYPESLKKLREPISAFYCIVRIHLINRFKLAATCFYMYRQNPDKNRQEQTASQEQEFRAGIDMSAQKEKKNRQEKGAGQKD